MAKHDSIIDASSIWAAPTSAERVCRLVSTGLARLGWAAGCARGTTALSSALEHQLLPFGTDLYRGLFRARSADAEWLAVSLLERVQADAAAARELWSLAGSQADADDRSLLAELAVESSRCVDGRLELLDLGFPGALDAGDRAALAAVAPGYVEGTRPDTTEPVDKIATAQLLDLQLTKLRSATLTLLSEHALVERAAGAARTDIVTTIHGISSLELTSAARLMQRIEVRTAADSRQALRSLWIEGLHHFERATAEEPIELLYNLRFGYYP